MFNSNICYAYPTPLVNQIYYVLTETNRKQQGTKIDYCDDYIQPNLRNIPYSATESCIECSNIATNTKKSKKKHNFKAECSESCNSADIDEICSQIMQDYGNYEPKLIKIQKVPNRRNEKKNKVKFRRTIEYANDYNLSNYDETIPTKKLAKQKQNNKSTLAIIHKNQQNIQTNENMNSISLTEDCNGLCENSCDGYVQCETCVNNSNNNDSEQFETSPDGIYLRVNPKKNRKFLGINKNDYIEPNIVYDEMYYADIDSPLCNNIDKYLNQKRNKKGKYVIRDNDFLDPYQSVSPNTVETHGDEVVYATPVLETKHTKVKPRNKKKDHKRNKSATENYEEPVYGDGVEYNLLEDGIISTSLKETGLIKNKAATKYSGYNGNEFDDKIEYHSPTNNAHPTKLKSKDKIKKKKNKTMIKNDEDKALNNAQSNKRKPNIQSAKINKLKYKKVKNKSSNFQLIKNVYSKYFKDKCLKKKQKTKVRNVKLKKKKIPFIKSKFCQCEEPDICICRKDQSCLCEVIRLKNEEAQRKLEAKKKKRIMKQRQERKKLEEKINAMRNKELTKIRQKEERKHREWLKKSKKHRLKLSLKHERILRKKRMEEMKGLYEGKVEDGSLLKDSVVAVAKIVGATVSNVFKLVKSGVTDPHGSWKYIKEKARDPEGTFDAIRGSISDPYSDYALTKKRLAVRLDQNPIVNILKDELEDTSIYGLVANKGKDADIKAKMRKKRIRQRENAVKYNCTNNFLITLRKTPCLWVYHICPKMYPQCLSCLAFTRDFFNLILLLLAIVVWMPCILCVEFCRAILCCFFCT